MNHREIVSFLWGLADLIRNGCKRGKNQEFGLPLAVLRRLDHVLARTKKQVLSQHTNFKGGLENLGPLSRWIEDSLMQRKI